MTPIIEMTKTTKNKRTTSTARRALLEKIFGKGARHIPPAWKIVAVHRGGKPRRAHDTVQTLYVDPEEEGLDAVVLGHLRVKRSKRWSTKVVETASAVVRVCQNKVRRGRDHQHDPRSYMAELGTQTRTTGRPLRLVPRPKARSKSAVDDVYRLFDPLAQEAEMPWANLYKAAGLSQRGDHVRTWGSKKPSLGQARAPNGMLTVNFDLKQHRDPNDGLGLTCCASKQGRRPARFRVGEYNLHVELGEGHHQWCFFGEKHIHGSEYAWPKSTPDRFRIRPVTAIDQIAWGSWAHIKVKKTK